MRSFTTTLAYFQTILLINGTVNTSAFVVLPSRSITTKLHAGRAPTGAELLKKTFDDASASAETISASKSSGGDAPNFFSYVSEDKKVSDLIGKLADASDNKSQYGIKGDTPTLASFFSNNDNIQQLGSVSKQNAAALKDSLNQVSPALENTLGAISKSFADLTATLSGFGNSFSQLKSSSTNGAGGDLAGKFNGFWDSLQIAENGPIYVAGVAILVAGLNNRAKGNEVAEAQAKVIEAADAAELAAKGANLTKQLAENADAAASKKAEELIAEKRTIELEVSKLKLESTKALETADKATKDASFAKEKSRALDIEASKKASEVKIDKEMMEVTISKLKVENTMAKEAAETATKEVSIAKEAVEKTNAEASSKAKGLEVEKETMEAEMSKLKAEITKATEEASIAKEAVEKTNAEASSKAKGLEVEKETMEAEMSKLKAEITKAAETSQDAAAKEASISKEMTESIDAKARDEVKALEAEKEMMKAEILKLQAGTTELKRAVELLTMTAKEKIATSTASEKTAAELLMEETNKGTRFVAKTSAGSEGNPWGSLKESTLKGRTKIQLTAYLEERNIDVTGMKKADLVNKIINL